MVSPYPWHPRIRKKGASQPGPWRHASMCDLLVTGATPATVLSVVSSVKLLPSAETVRFWVFVTLPSFLRTSSMVWSSTTP